MLELEAGVCREEGGKGGEEGGGEEGGEEVAEVREGGEEVMEAREGRRIGKYEGSDQDGCG